MAEYKVTFLDHVLGGTEAIKCTVYGRLIKEDKVSLTLAYWVAMDGLEVDMDNTEIVTVLKSTILSKTKLLK